MIYTVEDDAEIRELETYALKSSGFEVKSFASTCIPSNNIMFDIVSALQDTINL